MTNTTDTYYDLGMHMQTIREALEAIKTVLQNNDCDEYFMGDAFPFQDSLDDMITNTRDASKMLYSMGNPITITMAAEEWQTLLNTISSLQSADPLAELVETNR